MEYDTKNDSTSGVIKTLIACMIGVIIVLGIGSVVKLYNDPIYKFKHISHDTSFFIGSGCSGVLIDDEKGLILTNHHCVDMYIKKEKDIYNIDKTTFFTVPAAQYIYMGEGGTLSYSYSTKIIAYNEEFDLAVVKIKDIIRPTRKAAILYDGKEPDVGDKVYTLGNPFRFYHSIAEGRLVKIDLNISLEGKDFKVFQHDASQAPGSSGGGLFNENGELIGITNAGMPGYEINFAIPYYMIREFLTNNKIYLQ